MSATGTTNRWIKASNRLKEKASRGSLLVNFNEECNSEEEGSEYNVSTRDLNVIEDNVIVEEEALENSETSLPLSSATPQRRSQTKRNSNSSYISTASKSMFQKLESRIHNNHLEVMQTMQTLLHNYTEDRNQIQTQISVLSQKIDSIEDILEKLMSETTMERERKINKEKEVKRKMTMIDTSKSTAKALQEKKEKTREKREALIALKRDSNHVVQNIPKSESISLLLEHQIKSNIVFQNNVSSEDEYSEINLAFGPELFGAGNIIFQQGAEAEKFYVIEEGVLDVLQDGEHIEVLKAPASFGEISLLFGSHYNCTVCARNDVKLWSLKQHDYRTISGRFKLKRMQFKIDFLRKVRIGDKVLGEVLDPSDIDDMALATRNETFRRGDEIVKEGDKGNVFYMIEEGTVDVYKKECGAKPLVTLSSGNFFGEKALLNDDDVRQASCVATSNVKCLFLMREDFVRMLGNLQDLLDKSWSKQQNVGDKLDSVGAEVKKAVKAIKPVMNVKLEDLEVIRVLGTGAFSTVKLVKLKQSKHKVSLTSASAKAFALKCLTNNPDFNIDFDSLINNERNIMSDLDNPFIIKFYSEIRDSGSVFFLLEACLGGDLFNVLRAKSRFTEEWTQFYSASVLCAFDEIHSKKIAYRDLKPENLILDSKGYVKIIDFGLAKKIQGGKSWTLCGTPDYLSPEVILNEGHDWGVDYWALGVLVFEMSAGYCPFRADDQFEMYLNIVSGNINIPSTFSPGIGDLVRALLRKDLSKRLGKTKGGTSAVKSHFWFGDFNWDGLMRKKLKSPFLPDKEMDTDFNYITDQ